MVKRRLTSILVALAVLGLAVPSGPAGAGPTSPSGEEFVVGPITATLAPPTTTYRIVNADSWDDYYYEVYWDETTAGDPSPAEIWGYEPDPQSCGYFYANAAEPPVSPVSGTGDPADPVYRENSALWDHPNGFGPGFCPHEGTNHPGLVAAEVWESYLPDTPIDAGKTATAPRTSGEIEDPYFYEPIPDTIFYCEYPGSETGEGPPCEITAEPLRDACKFHFGRLVIASFTAAIILQFAGDNLIASLGDETTCMVPRNTLKRISILGSSADNAVTIDWEVLKQARLGLNLQGGANTLTLLGSSGQDWFGLHGIPPATGFAGGFAFDFNQDDLPDFSAMNVQNLTVDLGAGNDTMKVFPEYLYPQYSDYSLTVDGGQGTDKAMLLPSAAGRYNFGTDPAQPSIANVNLDSNTGDLVDVIGTRLEIWVPQGSPAMDVFTGAGGAGTGGVFQFKLRMFGGGGNDKLIGGAKDDTLNGGAGNNDVCKGGKGTDTATGCETKRSIPKPLLP